MQTRISLAPIACLGLLTLGLGLFSCSTLREVDPSLLNHPAMNLDARLTPERSSYLGPLGSQNRPTASGACSACAH